MNRKQTRVFYSSEFGYILISYAPQVNSASRCVIDPAIIVKHQVSSEVLGAKIIKALNITGDAQPIDSTEKGKFDFWKASGINRYSSFSKEFRCVAIYEIDRQLEIVEWKRDKGGEYVGSAQDDLPFHVSLDATPEQIGLAVIEILSGDATVKDDSMREFTTLDGNKVTYKTPSDAFIDIADGHTDAYQIYTHEDSDETSIVFFIGNQYNNDISEVEVRAKWQQWHGELSDFQYQETSSISLKVKVSGKTKATVLTSYLYQDGEALMEVMTKIDRIGTSEKAQREIEEELRAIIASIKFESL